MGKVCVEIMSVISNFPGWSFTIVGALLTILGSFAVQRYIRRRDAIDAFYADLSLALSELNIFPPRVSNTVYASKSAHDTAIKISRPHVRDVSGFDEAYRKYQTCRDAVLETDENSYPAEHLAHVHFLRESINELLIFAKKAR